MAKSLQKIEARRLRRAGNSIKDIAKSLAVSKSTVSVWCSDIKLSPRQIDILHHKMVKASYKGRLKGAEKQRQKKIQILDHFKRLGWKEIGKMNNRDLLMFGLGLYLGEGNKSGNNFQFVNSDPRVIRAIIKWLQLFGITRDNFYCNIILNNIYKDRIIEIEKYWASILKIPLTQFKKTVLIKSVNKKVYEDKRRYIGTMILRVYKSSKLLYKVLGLIDGALREFKKFLEGMNNEELASLRTNIDNGVVAEMVKLQMQSQTSNVCPVCERGVNEQLDLVLYFGPQGFRQKARFCGHDCLEYFLKHRKHNAQSLNNFQEDEN